MLFFLSFFNDCSNCTVLYIWALPVNIKINKHKYYYYIYTN